MCDDLVFRLACEQRTHIHSYAKCNNNENAVVSLVHREMPRQFNNFL